MQTFAIGLHHTQGDALGYVLVAPSGRAFIATSYPGDALGYALAGPSARSLNACQLQEIQGISQMANVCITNYTFS